MTDKDLGENIGKFSTVDGEERISLCFHPNLYLKAGFEKEE